MVENKFSSEPTPNFVIKGQYVKDLSFESPNAPHSLIATNYSPKIEFNIELKAQKLQENIYETVIYITTKAITDNSTLFLAELAYAGIFEVSNVPPEHIEPLAMIDCPFILFPFARRIISDLTRDGGFPPLMLEPIDFYALYMQNKASS